MAGPEPARGIGSSVATMVINADGTTADASPAALELLGLTLERAARAAAGCAVARAPGSRSASRLPRAVGRPGVARPRWRGARYGGWTATSVRVKFGITAIEDGRFLAMLEPVAGPTQQPPTLYTAGQVLAEWRAAERRMVDDPARYRRMARRVRHEIDIVPRSATRSCSSGASARRAPIRSRYPSRSDRHPDDLSRVRGRKGRFARWRRERRAWRARVRRRRPATGRGRRSESAGRASTSRMAWPRGSDGKVARISPIIPGIDLAGKVVACVRSRGSRSGSIGGRARLRPGRRRGTAATASTSACRPAGSYRWPTASPTRDAMAIGTAGFTAAMSVAALQERGLQARRRARPRDRRQRRRRRDGPRDPRRPGLRGLGRDRQSRTRRTACADWVRPGS